MRGLDDESKEALLVFSSIVMTVVGMIAGLFVFIMYLNPILLGINSVPRQGIEGAVELGLIFFGMFIGLFAGLFVWCSIARYLVSIKTYQRWLAQFDAGKSQLNSINRIIGSLVLKAIKPKGQLDVL